MNPVGFETTGFGDALAANGAADARCNRGARVP